ncbi:hypothetical protein VPH35_024809 [Triticum aestivum]
MPRLKLRILPEGWIFARRPSEASNPEDHWPWRPPSMSTSSVSLLLECPLSVCRLVNPASSPAMALPPPAFQSPLLPPRRHLPTTRRPLMAPSSDHLLAVNHEARPLHGRHRPKHWEARVVKVKELTVELAGALRAQGVHNTSTCSSSELTGASDPDEGSMLHC